MKYIDLHCDTLECAFLEGKPDVYRLEDTMLDVARLREAGCEAQFFAIFMLPPDRSMTDGKPIPPDDDYIRALRGILARTVAEHPEEIAMAGNISEIDRNAAAGKLSALLTLEDGRAVDGSLEKLEGFYGAGVRLISLTWNFANCLGFPNSADPAVMGSGLTAFGKDAVRRMNELGMLVDVSHLSDAGFWDVAKLSRKPFVASHSNCRALTPHRRNLTDEMIRALADAGGVAGLNFAPHFLDADPERPRSTVEGMVAHLRHLTRVGGMDCAAIGTDLDGISGELEIGDARRMELLFSALGRAGFSAAEVEKIAWRNARRVLTEVLG